MSEARSLGACPICGREMIDGPSVDRHHWIPRAKGGRETDRLHLICHRMIHRLFSEKELATTYSDPAAVRGHPDIRRFIAWVRRQPPEYTDWPRRPRSRK